MYMANQDWKVEREARLTLERFKLESLAIDVLARKAGVDDETTVKAIDKMRGELAAGAAQAAADAELKSIGATRKGVTTAKTSFDVRAVAMAEGFTLRVGRLAIAARAWEKASGLPAREAILAALNHDSPFVGSLVLGFKTFV